MRVGASKPCPDLSRGSAELLVRLSGVNLEAAADTEAPGRMDQYLYPLYEKDIREGRITRQEAAELLGCLWVKFNEMEV